MLGRLKLFLVLLFVLPSLSSFAAEKQKKTVQKSPVSTTDSNLMDELDPFDPAINQKLEELDQVYEEGTGESSHIGEVPDFSDFTFFKTAPRAPKVETCVREQCPVWVQVVKSTQTLYLYNQGQLQYTWRVSTGVPGRGTPNFDKHPDGRIYDRYTSTKFPGGDYRGMGNMPYAVFIQGGFAIHGTGESNWKRLGQRASHGCIRIHPDNAYYFNRLVRQTGVSWVWITVQD